MHHIAFASIFSLVFAASGFSQITAVNGASFTPGQPVAPGSIATIFGQNLCSSSSAAQSTQLPTDLGGCSVLVNGTRSQLYYASPGQINFVMPQGIAPGTASLTVNNGTQMQTGTMTVAPGAPGVFSSNGAGIGPGAIVQGQTFRPGPFSVITNGSPTPISMFLTGLDLSSPPSVTVGGLPATVTFFGPQGTYPGMQQINFTVLASAAGAGSVPVTVTSGGQVSNATSMGLLPTTSMMQGVPGWTPGRQVAENTPRANEPVSMALNPKDNTIVITDEQANAVRILSPGATNTIGAIALPDNSQARGIAVNDAGTLAGVALSGLNSVALVDLAENRVSAVIGVGAFPARVAFAGNNLLVTDGASDSVSVLDTSPGTIVQTVNVGHGPEGIAVDTANNRALVANVQSGTISAINLSDFSVFEVPMPVGSRPYDIAISPSANRAVITLPAMNSVVLMNLADNSMTPVNVSGSNAIGPSGIAVSGNMGFITNLMSANVTAMDIGSGSVLRTTPTDPGPRAVAINPQGNQMFVLAQGTRTIVTMSPQTGAMISRMAGVGGNPGPAWQVPVITGISPASAQAGTTVSLTITGSNLSQVRDMDFQRIGPGAGPGGMGPGSGPLDDTSITTSNLQVNADGTQITAIVVIAPSAAPGSRRVHLDTQNGDIVMGGPSSGALFTVTAP